jgi:hypothetical protein
MGRADRPDVFVVLRNDEVAWVSQSRNWALLLAYKLAEITCFSPDGGSVLTRVVNGQVYLPLPLARWAAVSGAVPGPSDNEAVRNEYKYIFADRSSCDGALSALWGVDPPSLCLAELRWALRIARQSTLPQVHNRVPIPADIRIALARLSADPSAKELIASNVPPFLIPHLKKLVRHTPQSKRRWICTSGHSSAEYNEYGVTRHAMRRSFRS